MLHFTGPPGADVIVTYCQQKNKDWGGLEIVTWTLRGRRLHFTGPPIAQIFSPCSGGRQLSSHNTKTEQDNQSTHQVDRLVKMHTSKACTHLRTHILFLESGPYMFHYDPGYKGQTTSHTPKHNQPSKERST